MQCSKCGKHLPSDARVCYKCKTPQTFNEPLDFFAREDQTIALDTNQSGSAILLQRFTFLGMIIFVLVVSVFGIMYFG